MSVQVTMVPTAYVEEAWDEVKDFIGKATDYTGGRYTSDDALDMLLNQGYFLWVAFEDREVKGAAISCFITYPRKKALYVIFLGGTELWQWKAPMLKMLQHWAYDNECAVVEAAGRPGWNRVFRDDALKLLYQTYELPAAATGLGA